eukprot:SAG11_NODE_6085_length_1391_cov_1.339009_1_plen_57_part_10
MSHVRRRWRVGFSDRLSIIDNQLDFVKSFLLGALRVLTFAGFGLGTASQSWPDFFRR